MGAINYELPKIYPASIKSAHLKIKKWIDGLAIKDEIDLTVKWVITKAKPKTIAFYTPGKKTITFKLNEKGFLYASADWENSKEGWHSTTHWWSTLAHELGHAIAYQYCQINKIDRKKWIHEVLNRFFGDILNFPQAFDKENWKGNPAFLVKKHISKYGSTKEDEAFAELFAIAKDWDHPLRMAAFKSMREIFK